jgi:hypothetical protein
VLALVADAEGLATGAADEEPPPDEGLPIAPPEPEPPAAGDAVAEPPPPVPELPVPVPVPLPLPDVEGTEPAPAVAPPLHAAKLNEARTKNDETSAVRPKRKTNT